MATRTVTTVFSVDGEKEYRQKVAEINRSIKELNSEMKLSVEQFKNNATSVEALTEKQDILQRTYDQIGDKVDLLKQAYDKSKESVDKYAKKVEDLSDEFDRNKRLMDEMADAGKKNTDEYAQLVERNDELEKQISETNGRLDKAVASASNWNTKLNDAKTELLKTGDALDEVTRELDDAKNGVDRYADSLDDASDSASEMKDKTSAAVEAIGAAMAAAGLDKAFNEVKDTIVECIDSAIEFESAMTGVFKTVNGDAEQLEEIKEGIKDLATEIPATKTEIAAVAEAAGQLGIATEDILAFTEVMINLGVSTNLSANEAAESLAKFANITGTSASDYERLGSVIVALGNNFATTEADIVSMATRLASTGSVVGLDEAQIFAIATALSSVGIEAEAGGSAISKLLKNIEVVVKTYGTASEVIASTGYSARDLELMSSNSSGDFKALADSIGVTSKELNGYIETVNKMQEYSSVAGMDQEAFADAWGENAVAALDKFITGLGNSEEAGKSAVEVLSEMDLTEIRLSNAILSLASSGGILTKSVNLANEAWDKNNALSEEARKRYETTESKITILQNSIDNLKGAIGEDFLAVIKPAIGWLTDFTNKMTEAAEESPVLSSALGGLESGLGALAGLTGAAAVIKGVSSALEIFGSSAGPVGFATTAIGAAAGAIAIYVANTTGISEATQSIIDANDLLVENFGESKSTYEEYGEALEKSNEKALALIGQVEKLSEQMQKTPADKAIIKSAVDELNELLPGLGLTYDSVTDKINLTSQAMRDFADDAFKTAKLEALQGYISDLSGQIVDLDIQESITAKQLAAAQEAYDKATAANQAYIESASKMGINLALDATAWEYSKKVRQAQKELKALQESLGELQDTRKGVESELGIVTDLFNTYSEELKNAVAASEEYGKNIAQGLARGMNSGSGIVAKSARDLAKLTEVNISDELEIRSPSRKTRRLGKFAGEGLALGVEDAMPDVEEALNRLTKQFDIEAELAEKMSAMQSSISGVKINPKLGEASYSDYMKLDYDLVHQAANAREQMAQPSDSRVIEITNVLELDGKIIGRKVSRTQWQDNTASARNQGVK